jgi:hypothetical protein
MARGVRLVAGGLIVAAVAAGCGGVARVSQTVVCKGPPPGSPTTLAHPLPCIARRTTLARATTIAGVRLVLPNTPLLRTSDVGPVWIDGFFPRNGHKTIGAVAVTFPAQGVIVEYTRPYSVSGDLRTHYQQVALGFRNMKVINLKRRPALVARQDSDDTRDNFGSVTFKLNRSEVSVLGHKSEKTLEALALSILNRSPQSR